MGSPENEELWKQWVIAAQRAAEHPTQAVPCPACGTPLDVGREPLADQLARERGRALTQRERVQVADARSQFLVTTVRSASCQGTFSTTTIAPA